MRHSVIKSRWDKQFAPQRQDFPIPSYLVGQVGADNLMAEKLAEALRERREAVARIIRKVEALDQGEKAETTLVSPDSQLASVTTILSNITNFEDVLKWAKKNFE